MKPLVLELRTQILIGRVRLYIYGSPIELRTTAQIREALLQEQLSNTTADGQRHPSTQS